MNRRKDFPTLILSGENFDLFKTSTSFRLILPGPLYFAAKIA